MKKFGYILMAAAFTSLAACSELALDEVNKDINHAPDAEAKFVFADAGLSTAYNVVGGDFNTYLGVATELWAGVHNQLYKADQRTGEWISSSCFNNSWNSLYNTIKNCRTVVEKTDEASNGVDSGNSALNAAAKVLLAYNASVLTDLFGDAPYTQACDYDKFKTPDLDKQEDIYKDIFRLLDEAIDQLKAAVASSPVQTLGTGSFDLIYNGDSAKWLKFAYGLRARLTLHTILKASNTDKAYDSILADLENSFTSSEEQAQIAVYDGISSQNPLFGFCSSREAIASSQSLYDKFAERNDPRMRLTYCWNWGAVFDPTDPEEGFEAVPNGEGIEVQWAYAEDVFYYSIDAPTHLLSYAEVEFIKAEVLARKNRYDDARDALKTALAETFNYVNDAVKSAQKWPDEYGYGVYGPFYDGEYLSDDDVQAYVDNVFAPLADNKLLGEIMVQKYLSFRGANGGAIEAFNDIRRLKAKGENFITLANPKNASGKFPLRCGYGSSDTTTNPNVQKAFGDGSYVFTENVWWAGGNR